MAVSKKFELVKGGDLARLLNLVEIKQKNEMCKYIHPIIPINVFKELYKLLPKNCYKTFS